MNIANDVSAERSTEQSPESGFRTCTSDKSNLRAERIVLVDDNSIMRMTTQRVLEELGFEVEAFANGQEAIETIARDPRPISLMVTDYNTPGLTGCALAQLVRIERPDVPVLIASSSDEDWIFAEIDSTIRPVFIQKPYSLKKLARMIREVLDVAVSELPSANVSTSGAP